MRCTALVYALCACAHALVRLLLRLLLLGPEAIAAAATHLAVEVGCEQLQHVAKQWCGPLPGTIHLVQVILGLPAACISTHAHTEQARLVVGQVGSQPASHQPASRQPWLISAAMLLLQLLLLQVSWCCYC